MDRRRFLSGVALTSASIALSGNSEAQTTSTVTKDGKAAKSERELVGPKNPVIISKYTGNQSSERAYAMLQQGRDTMDAVIEVLRTQEDDPNDDSVGYGGLPNEEGEVELDACVMHGPTRRAGAVAGVRNIKNVSMVARLVMERTNHLLLVGEGAQRFAIAHGFPNENLLTDHSRRTWLLWKETMSDRDSWGPGFTDPNWKPPVETPAPRAHVERARELFEVAEQMGIPPEMRLRAVENVMFPPTGTIHCSVVNTKGEMSGGTTTSGLAWKIPGRVGDSPIIGAGCFCDQEVGSAGATGSGEENIKIAGAHTVVENMRKGMSPEEAGMDALRRIARNHNNDMRRIRYLSMVFYILRRDGQYAGVSLWSNNPNGSRLQYHVNDGQKRLLDTVALFNGVPIDWPPTLDVKK